MRLALDFIVDGLVVGLTVERQVEFARIGAGNPAPDAEVTIALAALEQLAGGRKSLDEVQADGASIKGSVDAVRKWLGLHDEFDLWFDIVTP